MEEGATTAACAPFVNAVVYADPAAIMSLIRVGAINLGEEVFQSQINNLLMALNDDIANLVRVEFQSGGNPNPNTMSNNSGTRNVGLESSNSNNQIYEGPLII